ncbi:MAG: response regulator transcription factor [Bacteroidetes bacterium]|nr:response regulator transcription factor [Bacteroidota bacterium]
MFNIAIIEDDPMLREELTDFFKKSKQIYCALVVDTIEKFQHFYRPFMQIDIVLLDINLPGLSGLEGIGVVRNLLPDAEIIMHTVVNDHDTIFKCICAGATGYLLKNGDLPELESTLLSIKENDGCALTPSVARRIISYFQPKSRQKNDLLLSEQELKVIRFLVDGLSYQEVSDALNISINGVRYHIKNIYKKLHVKSKSALLRRYWEGGLDL